MYVEVSKYILLGNPRTCCLEQHPRINVVTTLHLVSICFRWTLRSPLTCKHSCLYDQTHTAEYPHQVTEKVPKCSLCWTKSMTISYIMILIYYHFDIFWYFCSVFQAGCLEMKLRLLLSLLFLCCPGLTVRPSFYQTIFQSTEGRLSLVCVFDLI